MATIDLTLETTLLRRTHLPMKSMGPREESCRELGLQVTELGPRRLAGPWTAVLSPATGPSPGLEPLDEAGVREGGSSGRAQRLHVGAGRGAGGEGPRMFSAPTPRGGCQEPPQAHHQLQPLPSQGQLGVIQTPPQTQPCSSAIQRTCRTPLRLTQVITAFETCFHLTFICYMNTDQLRGFSF